MNNVFIISQTRLKFVNALLFLVVISCFSSVTNADIETKKSLNSIVREYRDNASNWEAEIVKAANWLFWTLVAIDFAWLVLMMLFQKQDILDFLGSLIQRILIIGFFFILLTNGTTKKYFNNVEKCVAIRLGKNTVNSRQNIPTSI